MAVFCITPRQLLYEKVCYHENLTIYADCMTEWLVSFLQNISAVLKEMFPKTSLWPSVIDPVHLSDNVSLDIPSDITGWQVVPDKSPPKVYII